MFDIGWSELVVVGVVALVVIGPKELPGVIRSVGKAVGKLRTMAGEFRGQFDDAMREAELDDVKKTFTEMGDVANSAVNAATEPLGSIHDEMKSAVDEATGAGQVRDTLSSIEADAKSLEAEIATGPAPVSVPEGAPEPSPKPRTRRKKPADDAGEAP